jgi:hypothetical protein
VAEGFLKASKSTWKLLKSEIFLLNGKFNQYPNTIPKGDMRHQWRENSIFFLCRRQKNILKRTYTKIDIDLREKKFSA